MENKTNAMDNAQELAIQRFEGTLSATNREGMDKLLAFIRQKTDFYSAPASTRFHECTEGGLLRHSLNVYDCLTDKINSSEVWKSVLGNVPAESIVITALLHDMCKALFYKVEYKNQKTYDPEAVAAADPNSVKHDAKGNFIWQTVPYYTVEDKIPYGHGEKSVMMVEEFIKLTPEERYAIRWHMGFTEPKENYGTLGAAIAKYKLVLALHEADLEATYLLEG